MTLSAAITREIAKKGKAARFEKVERGLHRINHVRLAMLDFDDMGRDEGRRLGPKPGKGAVLHHCSGEADFDGFPGDELLPRAAVKRKLEEDAPTAFKGLINALS